MMIDTSIVIDLREEVPPWFAWSLDAVAGARAGTLCASAVTVSELASGGAEAATIDAMLAGFGVRVLPLDAAAAHLAGAGHRAYRQAGGTRERLIADFLIGGHAAATGLPLLTRDPGPYRRYFPDLTLIAPESHP